MGSKTGSRAITLDDLQATLRPMQVSIEDLQDSVRPMQASIDGLQASVKDLQDESQEEHRMIYAAIKGVEGRQVKMQTAMDELRNDHGYTRGLATKTSKTLDTVKKEVVDFKAYTESGFDVMNDRFDRLEDLFDRLEMPPSSYYEH